MSPRVTDQAGWAGGVWREHKAHFYAEGWVQSLCKKGYDGTSPRVGLSAPMNRCGLCLGQLPRWRAANLPTTTKP